jgi:predicted membrane-bound mannosyltransferase
LAAGLFFTISPYMMFYGRYTRNEAFCALFSVMTIYFVLRYLEEKQVKHLIGILITLVLNFTAKETAYIFTAELMVFLFVLAIKDFFQIQWPDDKFRKDTLLFNFLAIFGVVLAVGCSVFLLKNVNIAIMNGQIAQPTLADVTGGSIASPSSCSIPCSRLCSRLFW